MSLSFEKWHGIGNDFVLIEQIPNRLGPCDLPELARAMCDRTFGVGSDGLLVALASDACDRKMVMFNPDGSESEMCGNGLRCFARWHHNQVQGRGEYIFETGAGNLKCTVTEDNVFVEMGSAELLDLPGITTVELDGNSYPAKAVRVGNPHLVVYVPSGLDVKTMVWGPMLERHPAFENGTNVHFLSQNSDGTLRQITWERGAGVTLACGTGACACAVAAREAGWIDNHALVHLPGGDLEINLTGMNVQMVGPAEHSFTGGWLGMRGCWPDE